MAWLSRNNFSPTDKSHAVDLNNLANDIQNWGGNVNGGGYTLFNANIAGVFADPTTTVGDLIVHGPSGTPGVPGSLQRLPVGGSNGLALIVDNTNPLGLSWGAPSGGLVDPTTSKGDLIVRGATGPPTKLTIGADTQMLIADSSQPLGMRWGTITQFAAPGSDTQVMFNKLGVPSTAAGLVYNYSQGHLLLGGAADDGSAAVLQVAGQVHATMRLRCDQFFSAKTYPSSASLNVPDSGYGGWAYQGGSTYWYWFNTGWAAVDLSRVATAMPDPTTATGDLIVHGSAGTTRLPVGANGQVLQADSTQANGVKWYTPPPAGVSSVFGRTGAVVPAVGDYAANQVTNAADTTQSYSNPAWIATLSWGKITGAPTFLVSPLTTKGDLIVYGTAASRLQVGVDGQVLVSDSTQSLGVKWATPAAGVSAITPGNLVGVVNLAAGANVTLNQTGQTISISVPNMVTSGGMADPTTTTGDLIVHSQSGTTRFAVGGNGQVLMADSTQLAGVKWGTITIPPSGVTSISPGGLTGAVSFQGGTNINLSQAGQVITISAASIGMTDPTTTQGDLIVHTSTGITTRFAAGTSNGMVLVTDMTQPAGLRWASSGIGAAGSDQMVQINKAGTIGADAGFTYDYTGHNLWLTADGSPNALINARSYSGSGVGYGGLFSGFGARGSLGAPTATQSGDYQAAFRGYGWDGAAWQPSAQIAFSTTVNWAANNGAGFISFSTNPGGTTVLERMRITNAGYVWIGSANNPTLVNGQDAFRVTLGGGAIFHVGWDASGAYFGEFGGTYYQVTGYGNTALVANAQQLRVGIGRAPNTTLDIYAAAGTSNQFSMTSASAGCGQIYMSANVAATGPTCMMFYKDSPVTRAFSIGLGIPSVTGGLNDFTFGAYNGSAWAEVARITNAGLVGIGTPSPSMPLTIANAPQLGGLSVQGSNSDIGLSLQNTGSGGRDWRFFSSNGSSGFGPSLNFYDQTAGLSRMLITSGGLVGIGIASPVCMLDVRGATGGLGVLFNLQSTNSNPAGMQLTCSGNPGMANWAIASNQSLAGDLHFKVSTTPTSSPATVILALEANGNVGFGTVNPQTLIDTGTSAAPVKIATYTSGPTTTYGIGVGVSQLTFGAGINCVNGTPQMVLMSSGNLGVGTTAPAYRVDVAGDVNVTGAFRVNGTPFSGGGFPAWTSYTPTLSVGGGTIDYAGYTVSGKVLIVNIYVVGANFSSQGSFTVSLPAGYTYTTNQAVMVTLSTNAGGTIAGTAYIAGGAIYVYAGSSTFSGYHDYCITGMLQIA